ncbi:Arm DNA-binding domain-containing protein [Pseudophaeobacter sp.]|uniref:Arm DNA-binding domain-containing protein n=1 Tax=Pseudophaeobacter sp. TaxID=1971739 RepID=UPI00329A453B
MSHRVPLWVTQSHTQRWAEGWTGLTTLHKLSARTIKTLSKGKYSDGAGLWLSKSDLDGGKWFLRYIIHGQRREMGLGSIRDVSLKEARQQASHWREAVRLGKDPIRESHCSWGHVLVVYKSPAILHQTG